MMGARVAFQALRDRALGFVIGAVCIVATTLLALVVYADMDETLAKLIDSLPTVMVASFGITKDGSASVLLLGEMCNVMMPLTLAGLAIAMASDTIAGEERRGTLALLLANPVSRSRVLAEKAAALFLGVLLSAALMWLGIRLALGISGANTDGIHIFAVILHAVALAWFFGALALCIAASTGRVAAATGVSVGLLVVSFLGFGLLPMTSALDSLVVVLPWHYFAGTQPLTHGLNVQDLAVLTAASAVLLLIAGFGFRRRDLQGSTTQSFLRSLPQLPIVNTLRTKLAGTARVSSLWAKALGDSQTIALITAFAMFVFALSMGPLYSSLEGMLVVLAESLPETITVMLGGADMSRPEGFYKAEIFALTAPGALIFVALTVATRALVGQEDRQTMSLLLANPIPRWRVVTESSVALIVLTALVGAALFLGTVGANAISSLGMSTPHIAAACAHTVAVAVFFGAVGMLAGAATGRRALATYGTAGLALLAYVWNTFLPMSADLASLARLSPFHYYMAQNPLEHGAQWSHLALLFGASALLVAASAFFFTRRDLRG